MPKRASGPILTGLELRRDLPAPLNRQLFDGIRNAILSRKLVPGERLPSSRTLAAELGISRRTVVDVYLQLYAEGYIGGRVGAGTYVSQSVPEDHGADRPAPVAAVASGFHRPAPSRRFLAQRSYAAVSLAARAAPIGEAFTPCVPALDEFPNALWGRLISRAGRRQSVHALWYQGPAGYPPLREAIASYLGTARGVACSADDVLIMSGCQQAIALIAHVLLDPGDSVWVEDPGYFGVKGILAGSGVRMIPIPVDEQGISVANGRERCSSARAVFVTPSHQMPLGVTMSLARRLALLDWARERGAWIIEDDYDSEFHYSSRPVAALRSLDDSGLVIYTGTFSKVLFPSLRLAYVVAPSAVREALVAARALMDSHSPLIEQHVLAEFIREGHFERHLRRMRMLYANRQSVLVDNVRRTLAGSLAVSPSTGGMHLTGLLAPGIDDRLVAHRAEQLGVRTKPLSAQYFCGTGRNGLMLGYAAVPEAKIAEGVRRLAEALSTVRASDEP